MISCAKPIAVLATLALGSVSTGVALAGPTPTPALQHRGLGQYILKLSVPKTPVPKGSRGSDITADGHSATRVQLEVFASRVKCDRGAGAEKLHGGHPIINEKVVQAFSHSVGYVTGQGTHYACAYLYPIGMPNDTLARAEASWQVLK